MIAAGASILGFFTSGVGRWIAIALAFVIWTAIQRDQAADRARAECKAEQIQATLDETLRQLAEADKAVTEANEQADRSESEVIALEAERNRINEEAKQNVGECVIPESITRQLRNIK
jgi:hypothetical protein